MTMGVSVLPRRRMGKTEKAKTTRLREETHNIISVKMGLGVETRRRERKTGKVKRFIFIK